MGANSGVESKAETTNPKDLIGNTKVSITKLPQVAIVHGAMAMMDGAKKYGPYNWRAKKVVASIYIDAAMRHLAIWFEGQETASDSKVHHLGHAIACCAILLDAQATGNLVDDRPITEGVDPEWFEKLMGKLSDTIKEKNGSPSKLEIEHDSEEALKQEAQQHERVSSVRATDEFLRHAIATSTV